jgi:hypothetical protein
LKIRELVYFPWYPLLIAVLPLVRLYEANFVAVFPADFLRLTAIYLLAAGLLLAVTGLLWRSRWRGALVAAPLVEVLVAGNVLGGWLSLGLVLLAVGLGVILAMRKYAVKAATMPLNVAFVALVMLPLVSAWWTHRSDRPPVPTAVFAEPLAVQAASGAVKPDIWFLLVDGLGSPAFVEAEFKLSAAGYSDQMRRRGFRVPRTSFASYQQTGLSVASTWNVAHIPSLLAVPHTASRDRRVLYDLISNSRVLRALRKMGYHTVNLPSSYPMTRLRQADVHLEPALAPTIVEFALLDKSALSLVPRLLGGGPSDLLFAFRRRNLRYIFDRLPEARAAVPATAPALVFSHILAPHPPFVFDARGGAVNPEKPFSFADGSHWLDLHGGAAGRYPEKYRAQAIYVMERLAEAVDRIQAQATRPTVIIIQGDHGPGSRLDWERPGHSDHGERAGIFNAWYLPPGLEAELPEGVTAMETFPILFKTLFGAELSVAPKPFMVSRWSRPYIFIRSVLVQP